MIYVNVAGTSMLIVNTLDAILDLFEKRGSIYSSRQVLEVRMVVFVAPISHPLGHSKRWCMNCKSIMASFKLYQLKRRTWIRRMGWSWNLGLMPYGELWRAHRRYFHREFNEKASRRFNVQHVKAAQVLIQRLLRAPEDWEVHFRQ